MTFWLHVTAKARDDITRNAVWWAEQHSLDEALRWHDRVYEQLDEVLPFPDGYSLAPENELFNYEIREKAVGGKKRTYRAVFTVVGSEVRILTVRRAAQGSLPPSDL